MKPAAIVYTSNTGFTARYASLLGEETNLPVYSIKEADKNMAETRLEKVKTEIKSKLGLE
mgnify:CR=1 FL=1